MNCKSQHLTVAYCVAGATQQEWRFIRHQVAPNLIVQSAEALVNSPPHFNHNHKKTPKKLMTSVDHHRVRLTVLSPLTRHIMQLAMIMVAHVLEIRGHFNQ